MMELRRDGVLPELFEALFGSVSNLQRLVPGG